MDEKSTWSLTWRTMDKVSWSSRIYVRPTSKRWAQRKFRETIIFLKKSSKTNFTSDYREYSRIHSRMPNTHGTVCGWESGVLTITRSWPLARLWIDPKSMLCIWHISNYYYYYYYRSNDLINLVEIYDRGEPAVDYRWTGWVCKITGWSSKL